MEGIRLLSTDFDGTLIAYSSDGRCSRAFRDVLIECRESGGLWAVNTGRGLAHALEGVEAFAAPVRPDFLLTNEREVFRPLADGRWESYGEWNAHCHARHVELFSRSDALFDELRGMEAEGGHIALIHEHGRPAGLVTASEDVMERVADSITRSPVRPPVFGFQRNAIYLRFCHVDYHKGSALAELCRLEGIDREHVLAAGDNHNDLQMLDGTSAAMTACPANAIPQVKEAVRKSGGYVASRPFADGVAEAIRYFATRNEANRQTVSR